MRRQKLLVMILTVVACAPDRTITHGADGAADWDRRLRAAVAPGMDIGAGRTILVANGFQCAAADLAGAFWCAKQSHNRWAVVRRRWMAGVDTKDGRVSAVHSSTGLIAP